MSASSTVTGVDADYGGAYVDKAYTRVHNPPPTNCWR